MKSGFPPLVPERGFPTPYCPECAMPLDQGVTVAGRRAWFCTKPTCRWLDSAVAPVSYGITDTVDHFRTYLWTRRMMESKDALRHVTGW